jgi:lipopolysaccharide transport system permease protein
VNSFFNFYTPSFSKSSPRWLVEVLWTLAAFRVKMRYKETFFGYGWFLLQPVGLTVLFTYLFHQFDFFAQDKVPYPLFAALGLVPWSITELVVSQSAFCISHLQELLKRVALPKMLLPLSTVLACGVDLAAMTLLLGALSMYYRIPLFGSVGWTFILVGIHLALLVGLSCLASLTHVFFRDMGQAIPFLLKIWFFSSPVFYSSSLLPAKFLAWARWNPLSGLIEGYRSVLLLGETPPLELMGPAALVSIFVLISGLIIFWRLESKVVDAL